MMWLTHKVPCVHNADNSVVQCVGSCYPYSFVKTHDEKDKSNKPTHSPHYCRCLGVGNSTSLSACPLRVYCSPASPSLGHGRYALTGHHGNTAPTPPTTRPVPSHLLFYEGGGEGGVGQHAWVVNM